MHGEKRRTIILKVKKKGYEKGLHPSSQSTICFLHGRSGGETSEGSWTTPMCSGAREALPKLGLATQWLGLVWEEDFAGVILGFLDDSKAGWIKEGGLIVSGLFRALFLVYFHFCVFDFDFGLLVSDRSRSCFGAIISHVKAIRPREMKYTCHQ